VGALILRELKAAVAGGNALLPLIFFLLVATLFPFAIGPDRAAACTTGRRGTVDGGNCWRPYARASGWWSPTGACRRARSSWRCAGIGGGDLAIAKSGGTGLSFGRR
jgi:hypothetical protein